ncbi:1905_t:CDS:1 [Paraglomus occultum]|uniref:1905_t:CDS:1 n=1 Tax=Paraglomus occultum TaxID=144539 RepID=A0A9N8ZH44_9GLOM|nr:1905_t:CDS:1 [Paraglomus occultum]
MSPKTQIRQHDIRQYNTPSDANNGIHKKKQTHTSPCDPTDIARQISINALVKFALDDGYQRQIDPSKRPLNCYMQFQCSLAKYARVHIGPIPRPILTKVASILWKNMGDQRGLFSKFAEEGEADHCARNPQYRFHPRRQKPVMRVNPLRPEKREVEEIMSPPQTIQVPEVSELNLYAPQIEYPLFEGGYDYINIF